MKIINFLRARFRKWLNEEYWMEDYLKMGMKVGKECDIHPGLIVDYSHCWLIDIGNRVTIAPHVYLLAHDASTKRDLNYTRIGNIKIEDFSFIGARSVIMPNVTIGKNAIVAAGSVVTKSVAEGTVVGGNPAKYMMKTSELMEKHSMFLETTVKYDSKWTIRGGITPEMKDRMKSELKDGAGYVI